MADGVGWGVGSTVQQAGDGTPELKKGDADLVDRNESERNVLVARADRAERRERALAAVLRAVTLKDRKSNV